MQALPKKGGRAADKGKTYIMEIAAFWRKKKWNRGRKKGGLSDRKAKRTGSKGGRQEKKKGIVKSRGRGGLVWQD